MTIYIGADHRGFALKEELKEWLGQLGHSVVDCGNTVYDKADDFTDFAFKVAEAVAEESTNRGIVVCGSGVGVNIAANKVKGIRASTALNTAEVIHAREHDDLNVLALSSEHITTAQAKEYTQIFLETKYLAEERHVRRLNKISEYEERKQ